MILCAVAVGLSYWLSSAIERLQRETADDPDRVRVAYAEGFYLLVAAALLSLLAVTVTLYRCGHAKQLLYDESQASGEKCQH